MIGSLSVRGFLVLAIIISFFHKDIVGQSIRGQILDYKTSEPLPFANIYFNGSFHGTTSDSDGNFGLNIGQKSGQEIVVSYTGYKSYILKEYSPGEFYEIQLQPQAFLLNDIQIIANDIPRKRKEEMFLKEFLGKTRNAKNCQVENIEDVKLVYMKSSKTLLAFCSKPLIIYNRALGYKITYFLEDFKSDENSLSYHGNSIFENDTTNSDQDYVQLEKRRKKAYLGSRMHFFRMLWSDDLEQSDFDTSNSENENKMALGDHVVRVDDNMKSLYCPNVLQVSYRNYQMSLFIPKDDSIVRFAKNGYFDTKSILLQGDITMQRVGDLLPFEYWPKPKK